MSSMVPNLSLTDGVLNADQIAEIMQLVRRQPESNWVHADQILVERGVGVTSANYDMLYDRVLTEGEREFLRSLAPTFPDAVLQTQVINRYKVDGFLCDHTDRQMAKYNTIIPLQSHGDGLRYYTRDEYTGEYIEHFLEDKAGRMTVLTDAYIIHGVPLVKRERYVFINIFSSPEEAPWNPYESMYQHQS